MRLAHADRRIDVERIERGAVGQDGFGDLDRASVGDAVRRADDEVVERVMRVERRALEAADAGAAGTRAGRTDAEADGPAGAEGTHVVAGRLARLDRLGV